MYVICDHGFLYISIAEVAKKMKINIYHLHHCQKYKTLKDKVYKISSLPVHLMEKAMAPHSSTLAWRIPGAGEPGGLISVGSHRVGHD